MDYTLVLGIEYQKHKRPATVDLFIGGQLIDSFEMDQDQSVAKDPLRHVDRTWYEQNGRANWLDGDREYNGLWSAIPNYYRIYKLPEETLNGQLEIKVKNDSNNYTNGFMTKSSLIRFTVVALLPSRLLITRKNTLMELIHWAHKQRGDVPFPGRQRWPTTITMHIKTDEKNYKCDDVQFSWIGGNFTAVMDIKVKHKVKYLHSPGRIHTGFGAIDTGELSQLLTTLKPLINIYNEDQRSNST